MGTVSTVEARPYTTRKRLKQKSGIVVENIHPQTRGEVSEARITLQYFRISYQNMRMKLLYFSNL